MTATAPALKLPAQLRGHETELGLMLSTPVPGTWPEGETYCNADQPRAIAQLLIDQLFPELNGARVLRRQLDLFPTDAELRAAADALRPDVEAMQRSLPEGNSLTLSVEGHEPVTLPGKGRRR